MINVSEREGNLLYSSSPCRALQLRWRWNCRGRTFAAKESLTTLYQRYFLISTFHINLFPHIKYYIHAYIAKSFVGVTWRSDRSTCKRCRKPALMRCSWTTSKSNWWNLKRLQIQRWGIQCCFVVLSSLPPDFGHVVAEQGGPELGLDLEPELKPRETSRHGNAEDRAKNENKPNEVNSQATVRIIMRGIHFNWLNKINRNDGYPSFPYSKTWCANSSTPLQHVCRQHIPYIL